MTRFLAFRVPVETEAGVANLTEVLILTDFMATEQQAWPIRVNALKILDRNIAIQYLKCNGLDRFIRNYLNYKCKLIDNT